MQKKKLSKLKIGLLAGTGSVLAAAAIAVPIAVVKTRPDDSAASTTSAAEERLQAFSKKYPGTVSMVNGKAEILADAFANRTDLPDDFYVPSLITRIGNNAFDNVALPAGFTIPETVTDIAATAFKDVVFDENHYWNTSKPVTGARIDLLDQNEEWTAFNKAYPDVLFKKAVKSRAFENRADLPNDFALPAFVTSVGAYAFAKAKLPQNFNLPDGVSSLGQSAFDSVVLPKYFTLPSKLVTLGLLEDTTNKSRDADTPFLNATLPAGFTLPATVTRMAADAFQNAKLPPFFSIPQKTAIWQRDANANWTAAASYALQTVITPDGWQWADAAGGVAGSQLAPKEELKAELAAFKTAYPNTVADQGITGVVKANSFAQRNDLPADFALPRLITDIEAGAFSGATLPNGFTVPLAAVRIASSAFNDVVFDSEHYWDMTTPRAGSVIADVEQNDEWKAFNEKYPFALDKKKLKDYAFEKWKKFPSDFALPSCLTTIGELAFSEAFLPEGFNLPDNVSELHYGSFASVTMPASFTLPSKLERIGVFEDDSIKGDDLDSPFYGTSFRPGFTIPDTVKEIEGDAFSYAFFPAGFSIPSTTKIMSWNNRSRRYITDPAFVLFDVSRPLGWTWSSGDPVAGSSLVVENTSLLELVAFDFAYPNTTVIENGWGEIKPRAFEGRTDLPADFALPGLIKKIGAFAFKGVPIPAGFIIPYNTSEIDPTAFSESVIADENLWQTTVARGGSQMVPIAQNTEYSWFVSDNGDLLDGRETRDDVITGGYSFQDSFALPNFIRRIGNRLFKNAVLSPYFTLPDALVTIGVQVFAETVLPDGFKLPDGVTTLETEAFKQATLPKNFALPSHLQSIGFPMTTGGPSTRPFDAATISEGFKFTSPATSIAFDAFINAKLPVGFQIPESARIYVMNSDGTWSTSADNALTGTVLPANAKWSDARGAVAGSKIVLA